MCLCKVDLMFDPAKWDSLGISPQDGTVPLICLGFDASQLPVGVDAIQVEIAFDLQPDRHRVRDNRVDVIGLN